MGLVDRLLWHSGAVLIGYVCVLHTGWALLVFVSGKALLTTPLNSLADLLGEGWLLALILLGSAAAATLGAKIPRRLVGLALMLPQQTVLVIVAFGALRAVMWGMYPDGTEREWVFILTDQLGIIILTPAYTVAILTFHNVFRRVGG